MRPDIRELIQSGKTCVLATVSEGQPHCSLMSYAADENGREIYMATLSNTKKYKNLVVRVSGFSAYYITLSKEVQEDILKRTEQE